MKTIIISAALLVSSFYLAFSQEYKVRLGSVIPKDSPWEEALNSYIDYAKQQSGGKLIFRTYLGGQLGGEVEMVKSVALGTLHAGAFSTAAVAEALNLPILEVFELPFLFENDAEADHIMDEVMFQTMYDALEKKGLLLVMWGTNGWRNFGTREKPILKPSDLIGLKMRSQEADVYVKFYKSLGATPVPIATPEVLVSLKTGMVDGFDQTSIFNVATGWITTAKHYTLSKHIYQPGCIVISKRYYNKLPDDVKKAIMAKSGRVELTRKSRTEVREADKEMLKAIEDDFGINVIRLNETQRNEFKKVTKPVYSQMTGKIPATIIQTIQSELKKLRSDYKKASSVDGPKLFAEMMSSGVNINFHNKVLKTAKKWMKKRRILKD